MSCSRRWIPDGARATAARAVAAAGTGGKPCRAGAAAVRNVEAASCGAALPWRRRGTASASTAAALPLAAVVASAVGAAAPPLENQSR